MAQYFSPGVYIEEINTLPLSIPLIPTAIPVFLGRTEVPAADTELHRKPTRITSMIDYIDKFGTAPKQKFDVDINEIEDDNGSIISTEIKLNAAVSEATHNMYYAMQMFYANGGGPCYVMSLGPNDSAVVNGDFDDVFAILEEYDEPTLIVMPDAVKINEDKHNDQIDAALAHCNKMKDRFLIADVHGATPDGVNTLVEIKTAFREDIITDPDLLKYGAVYFPYLMTSLNFVHDDSTIEVKSHTIKKQDGTNGTSAKLPGIPKTLDQIANIKETHNALYFSIKDFVANEISVVLPPSSSLAGVYAKTDRNRGIWKAPANVGLANVKYPLVKVTQDLNDGLNEDPTGKAVNPIREFSGKGSLVWGARTLNAGDLNWRFVNVRREVIFIEESIKKALEGFVFEPNTAGTWVKVKTMITAFLTGIWKDGGLAGAKAEDAFEVRIGVNITMTPMEVAQGIMNVEIILVPPRPAEKIILKVSQKLQTS